MTQTLDTILENARKHCAEDITPNVDAWNKADVWPHDASDKAAALGLTGLYAPPEWGGQGLSFGDGIRNLDTAMAPMPLPSRCTTFAPMPVADLAPMPSKKNGRAI